MQTAQLVTPRQTAAIKATCTRVMRLREGEAEFDGCVSDLSDTAARQIQYARAIQAYNACTAAGLKRKTPEFSRCVLGRENAEQAANTSAPDAVPYLDVADVKSADSNPDSYYAASFDVRRRREQYACAQLELEPDTRPFVNCVNNLDTDLFNIAHPLG